MRRFLISLILLTLVLTACQAKAPLAPDQAALPPSPSASPAAAAKATPTRSSSIPAGCTVVSPKPTAGPTEQSLFPPVTEKDWSSGPAGASVTFIEYSDFM